MLLVQTGDETLDYREVLEKYPNSPCMDYAWRAPRIP